MKILIKVFFILSVLLFFIGFGEGLYGNPISKHLATKQITNFMNDTLHIKKFEIKNINKNIKYGGNYFADVYDKDNNAVFQITSTEKNVTWHSISNIKQPTNVDKINYSSHILGNLLLISIALFVLNLCIYCLRFLIKKIKDIVDSN